MRIVSKVILIVFVLMILGYFGQARKACVVKEFRFKQALEKGEMTKEEYDESIKRNTFIRMVFSPKYVISVD